MSCVSCTCIHKAAVQGCIASNSCMPDSKQHSCSIHHKRRRHKCSFPVQVGQAPIPDWVPAGFLFTLDIFLLFHTGFIITCNLRKRLIMDGYFVACYYAKHANLVMDVLATIPSWIEVSQRHLPWHTLASTSLDRLVHHCIDRARSRQLQHGGHSLLGAQHPCNSGLLMD